MPYGPPLYGIIFWGHGPKWQKESEKGGAQKVQNGVEFRELISDSFCHFGLEGPR